MSVQTITVTGMTCGHCVSSVREEVGGIPGVTAVEVDLATGRVTIQSETRVDAGAITDAVGEAGYEVAS
jgi:copper chaperone